MPTAEMEEPAVMVAVPGVETAETAGRQQLARTSIVR
jgi:hypothetical protein